MPEMTKTEKFFVNRRGLKSLSRLLDKLERSGQISLTSSSSVLELGGGNGKLSLLVNERYHPARIHLTDYDRDQLAVAQATLARQYGSIPPSIRLERGDATRLQYADEAFDFVIAHLMLHHLGGVPELLRGLDEVNRVLRPGGRFFYVEMFHKQEIREHLAQIGLAITFHERKRRWLNTMDIVVAVKPMGPTAASATRIPLGAPGV